MQPPLLGFFAAFLLPICYLGIPNPLLLAWHYRHGKTPPPADLARRAERANNLIPFVALATVLVTVLALLRQAGLNLTSVGLTYAGMRAAVVLGIAAGLAWLSLYVAILVVFRPPATNFSRHLPALWKLSLWLPLSLSSATIEEIWRAYCLISLAEFGNVVAVLVTTTAYALAHFQPLGRALSTALFGSFAAYLFLATHLVWIPIFAHATLNIGVFFLIRWRLSA